MDLLKKIETEVGAAPFLIDGGEIKSIHDLDMPVFDVLFLKDFDGDFLFAHLAPFPEDVLTSFALEP